MPAILAALFCRSGQPRYAQPFFRHLGYEAADDPRSSRPWSSSRKAAAGPTSSWPRPAVPPATAPIWCAKSYPLPRIAGFRRDHDGMAEPALVLAVARQESLFDPVARSSAGAMGLMQLMPGTAQTVSRELGEDYTRGRLVRDPDYNIRLGAYYLGQQLARFDHEPVLALAAYNAGPGA